jgi:lipopolysaccharide export system protein LptA
MIRIQPFAPLFFVASIMLAGPASSQSASVSALKGHNSQAPVDVVADRIELQDRADRALLSGNVEIKQAELTLNAPRVTVAYTRAGGTEIQRLDASGGVTVKSPSETAQSQYAIYDFDQRLITMIGDVKVNRSGSLINGNRLVINLDSGRATMDGARSGGSASGGRVTGRFTVPKRNP